MWHVPPVKDEEAQGLLRELYDQELASDGYVKNSTRLWSRRVELQPHWMKLVGGIRSHLRLRAYELVTLAASRAIGCVY